MSKITCTKCGVEKDSDKDFHKALKYKQGYRQPCKTCRHTHEYEPAAEEIKSSLQEQYETDPEFRARAKAKASQQYLDDPEGGKIRSRKSTLKRYYKMTPTEYAIRSEAQDHKCLICGRTAEEADPYRKDLCVDHDHSCCPGPESCGNCIRGLICSTCNSALGHFQDSIERIQAAIEYLNSFKPKICIVA